MPGGHGGSPSSHVARSAESARRVQSHGQGRSGNRSCNPTTSRPPTPMPHIRRGPPLLLLALSPRHVIHKPPDLMNIARFQWTSSSRGPMRASGDNAIPTPLQCLLSLDSSIYRNSIRLAHMLRVLFWGRTKTRDSSLAR